MNRYIVKFVCPEPECRINVSIMGQIYNIDATKCVCDECEQEMELVSWAHVDLASLSKVPD